MCETVDAIYRADSRGVPSRVAAPSEVKTNRAFNTALWRYILDYLEVQAPDGDAPRGPGGVTASSSISATGRG